MTSDDLSEDVFRTLARDFERLNGREDVSTTIVQKAGDVSTTIVQNGEDIVVGVPHV